MAENTVNIFIKSYWNYYLELEEQFVATKRFVEFDISNSDTYSVEYLKLFQAVCSEIDVVANVLHNIIIYDDKSSTKTIIGIANDITEVEYGDEIKIDYVLYTPGKEATDSLNIRLYAIESGSQVNYANSTLINVENQVVKTWTTSEYPTSGKVYVEFTSGDTTKTLEFNINAGSSDYDIDTVEAGLVYDFESSTHSNNDSDKETYIYPYTDSSGTVTQVKAVNTGFNWASNGYIDTDYGVALRMSGNAKHTIKLPIFQTSYTDDEGQTVKLEDATGATVTTKGRTIEFDFVVSKVTDRNTEIIKCMANDVGFVITPQVCYLLSANGAAVQLDSTGFIENEESIAAAYLQPDQKIHLGFVIEPVAADGRQCINVYINGKYANSIPYDADDRFTQLQRANFWTASTDILSSPLTYNGQSYYTEREYKKAIFVNEFEKHFKLQRALEYYAFIEFVALVDNRAKNMFIHSENVKAENLVFTDGSVTSLADIVDSTTGDVDADKIDWEKSTFAVWFIDPYDLDSCFGAENSGYLRVPYYAEWDYQLNASYQFNGYQSYFWLMFEEAMQTKIKEKVQTLANGRLNYENFYKAHITDGTDKSCAALVNRDMVYKYSEPWTEGYYDYSTSETDPAFIKTNQYKYLQRGDRMYQKGDFMYARSHMMYSKYQTSQFLNDNINFRAGVDVPQADTGITLEAMQALYLAVKYGDSGDVIMTNGKIYAGNFTTIKNSGNVGASDTVYMYSASDLTDIGDISAFRPYEIQLTRATRLKKLLIGSNKTGYVNGRLSALDLSTCALLTEINVVGCTSLTGTLDLTNNGLIEKVYAKNSGVAFVKLPNGGMLSVLQLPKVTNLTAQNQTSLTDFSCEGYDNLNTLRVENTPLIPALDILKEKLPMLTGGVRVVGIDSDIGTDTTVLEMLVSADAQGKYLNNNGVLSEDKTAYPYISGKIKVKALGTALLAQLNELYPYLTITVFYTLFYKHIHLRTLGSLMLQSAFLLRS